MRITPAEKCWLRLSRAPGVGNATLLVLLDAFVTPEKICEATAAQLRKVLGDKPLLIEALCDNQEPGTLEQDVAWLSQDDCHLISILDSDYPPLLREIPDPPVLIYVRGKKSTLSLPQLAVVGSRNPTPAGSENAIAFARALTRAGLVVTSGLAQGIDSAAHKGALESGATVAVTGTGLDRVYPSSSRDLSHRIVEKGAMVSEFPLGTPPKKENFPRRNRLIAGLCLGTLVVEAALKSGSLITARLAGEQGREVFAIPGSIHSPLTKGCHYLIRQGAKLVETAGDILEELGPLVTTLRRYSEETETNTIQDSPEQKTETIALFTFLGHDPVDVDTLVERSGLTPEAISSMLLELELDGEIASCAGGKYQRLKT